MKDELEHESCQHGPVPMSSSGVDAPLVNGIRGEVEVPVPREQIVINFTHGHSSPRCRVIFEKHVRS